MTRPVRVGRIGYLNVLPLYHPLESGLLDCDFEFVSGPPAELNRRMAAGELDISSASSIEYARRPERYLLVPDLAIGCQGPVQSVLLLSRVPVDQLDGRQLLVSSQTHTSAALLRLLLEEDLGIHPAYTTGNAMGLLKSGARPDGLLAIGDEALRLRRHPDYQHVLDLGQAWLNSTGLPFIFGLWLVSRRALSILPEAVKTACLTLLRAKQWGMGNMKEVCKLAARQGELDELETCSYFDGLGYDLGTRERQGLELFFTRLAGAGIIDHPPELDFLELDGIRTPETRAANGP